MLIKAGAEINIANSFRGATPLHCAVQENDRGDETGRMSAIKMLLAAGADVNICDAQGEMAYQVQFCYRPN